MIKRLKHILIILLILLITISSKTFAAKTNFDQKGNNNQLRYKETALRIDDLAKKVAEDEKFKKDFINEPFKSFVGAGLPFTSYAVNARSTMCLVHAQSDFRNQQEYVYRIKTVVDIAFGKDSKGDKKLLLISNSQGSSKTVSDEYAAKLSYAMYLVDKKSTVGSDWNNIYKELVDYYLEEAIKNGSIDADKIFAQTSLSNNNWGNGESQLEKEDKEAYNGLKKYVSSVKDFIELEEVHTLSSTGEEIKPKEIGTTPKLGDDEYIMVGPMKVKYGGNGIDSIVINEGKKGAKAYTDTNSKDIYWAKGGTNYKTDAQEWNNNWKKIPSNRGFYLAIKKSALPQSGDGYTITLNQKPIEWYKGRLILMTGSFLQQLGTCASFGNNPETQAGKVVYEIEKAGRNLIIEKVDKADVSKKIKDVGMKIYAELTDGTKGWVKTDSSIAKAFSADGTMHTTDANGQIKLTNIKDGDYYIYEVKAGEGYTLEDQRNKYPDSKDPNNFAGKTEYSNAVFLGKLEKGTTKTKVTIAQYKAAELTVRKVDSKNPSVKLNGVKFAIFVADSGWLGYDSTTHKVTFENSWTNAFKFSTGNSYCGNKKADGEFKLSGLRYGNYYVIEVGVGANENYKLSDQAGYNKTSDYAFLSKDIWKMKTASGNTMESVLCGNNQNVSVANSDGTNYNFIREQGNSAVDYIHLDWYSSSYKNSKDVVYYGTNNATYTIKNNPQDDKGTILIIKKDSKTQEKLIGAKFKICFLNDGIKEWVNSSNGKPDGVISIVKDEKNATEFEITDKEGIGISNLPYGSYDIYETKAPAGYIIKTEKTSITIDKKNKGYVEVTILNVPEEDKGKLEIIKQYEKTKENIVGAEFIISKQEENKTLWVHSSNGKETGEISLTEDQNSATAFKVDKKEGITISGLPYGNYKLKETKAPNGYILPEVSYDVSISKENKGLAKIVILNKPEIGKGKLKIVKIDKDTNKKLIGAEFKIFNMDQNLWVHSNNGKETGEINLIESEEKATQFKITDESGIVIPSLPLGKYKIYETKAPDGYEAEKTAIEATISEEDKEGIATVPVYNKKVQSITIEGTVWEDRKYIKAGYNHVLDIARADSNLKENTDNPENETDGDTYIKGISVELVNKEGKTVATTKTDEKGHYVFVRDNAGNLLTESLIKDCYVAFKYDMSEFVTVKPNVGNDTKVSSKAQEETVTKEKLNDQEIKNSKITGYAITDKSLDLTTLMKDNKIENINLGLMRKVDPTFSVSQDLAYVTVKLNGNTYKYYPYGKTTDTSGNEIGDTFVKSSYVPKVYQQTYVRYVGPIYPSVIEQIKNDQTEVYVVYKITVKNDETVNEEYIYNEQKLYIESLTNTFDTNRYELYTGNNDWERGDQFSLWSAEGNKAQYNLSAENSVYKNGIDKNKGDSTDNNAVSTFIQFRMKEEERKNVFAGIYENENVVPTVTDVVAYHDYLRKDNIWDANPAVRSYKGTAENGYTENKEEFTHRSINETAKSFALYIHVKPGDGRTLSGKVFIDKANQEGLGNGILEEKEDVVSKVKVELLNADGTDANVIDERGDNSKGEATTNEQGEFEIHGVTSGNYMLRFTYGDGNQYIYDYNNTRKEAIKVNDYKSTIINEQIRDTIQKARENNNIETWYKNISKNYSVALDDVSLRKTFNDNEYSNGGQGRVEVSKQENDATSMQAYTPKFALTDEEDTDMSVYSSFNFGIVEIPKTELETTKVMKNIEVTSQVGSTLLAQAPKATTQENTGTLKLSDLDKTSTLGSNELKIEAEQEPMYGAEVKIHYDIKCKNNSVKDYTTEEYYYYGIETPGSEKLVKIVLSDALTKDCEIETMELTSKKGASIKIEKEPGSQDIYTITGWEGLQSGEEDSIEYVAKTKINSSEDDLLYTNVAQVKNIKIEKTSSQPETEATSETQDSEEAITVTSTITPESLKESETRLTITPPTGEDRNPIYWTTAFVSLIVVAGGIVILKKKVLNNE